MLERLPSFLVPFEEVTVLTPAAGETEPATEHQETESVSSDRPAGETIGLALATAALAALGAALLWLSRTRAHPGIG